MNTTSGPINAQQPLNKLPTPPKSGEEALTSMSGMGNANKMWLGLDPSQSGKQPWATVNPNVKTKVPFKHGQLTPPDDDQSTNSATSTNVNQGKQPSRTNRPIAAADTRKDSTSSTDGQSPPHQGAGIDKRKRYREKNRVAAAKCRAKKKVNTDNLEETYRTQSMLNVALRQTDQSLRDELSFWKMQALQHTFCGCKNIQEYNMTKARDVAGAIGPGSAFPSNEELQRILGNATPDELAKMVGQDDDDARLMSLHGDRGFVG